MEGTNKNSKTSQGTDLSSMELLCGGNLSFSSALTRKNKWDLKNILNVSSCDCGSRSNACGSSDTSVNPATCEFAQSVVSLAKAKEEESAGVCSAAKRWADGANPSAAPVPLTQPLHFFATNASGKESKNSGGDRVSSAFCAGCRLKVPQELPLQLRKVLENRPLIGDEYIFDEPYSGFVDNKAFSEFVLQQPKGGVCVSLECADDMDEQGNDSDRKAIVLTAANSSSFSTFSDNSSAPWNDSLRCDHTSLLSAMLKLGSSCCLGSALDKKDDNAGAATGIGVRLSGGTVETISKMERHLGVLELLQSLDIRNEGGIVEVDNCCDGKRAGFEGEKESNDCEGLDDIQKIVDKISLLGINTIKELRKWWDLQLDAQEGDQSYLMSIIERFCLISVTILGVVAERLDAHLLSLLSLSDSNQRQKCNYTNGNASDNKKICCDGEKGVIDLGKMGLKKKKNVGYFEAVRFLFFSLRKDVHMLSVDHMRCLATMFGLVDCCHVPDDVFLTIFALGVFAFFSPLPLPLLEAVCRELSISCKDEATGSVDPHHLPAMLAVKISHYFYPLRHSLPSIAKLPFMPQMQIHEHAPGRYTCTVDNANFLRLLTLHRLVSNRFSCNKIHWYALLTVFSDNISFFIWHRHSSSLTARIVIRTQDPKKKRKNTSSAKGNNEAAPNPDDALRESSALFLEQEAQVAPGELIGFENFVTLPVALSSLTVSQSGYRLYSCAEDRIVFQCALDLSNPDGTPLVVNSERKKTSSNSQGKKGSMSTKQQSGVVSETTARGLEKTQETTSTTGTTTSAAAEDEKRSKELSKAVSRLEKAELRDRNAIDQLWSQGHCQLINEHAKSYQKAVQKTKDRERKLLLAKIGPSPELQRELETLMQAVVTNRSQVAKMAKAKAKEEDAIKKLREQIEEGNKELERFRQQLKNGDERLAKIEAETAACAARAKEHEEARRRKQRELAAALRIPDLSATRHETLAINDLQSFWAHSFANGTSLSTVAPASSLQQQSPRRSPPFLAAGESDVNPASSFFIASSAVLPSRSAVVNSSCGNGGGLFSQPLPSVPGGVLSAGASTWAPPVVPPPFSSSMSCDSVGNAFDVPQAAATTTFSSPTLTDATRLISVDGACGQAAAQAGGFTVTAPFATTSAIQRFALDAKARPFTPTAAAAAVATATATATPQATCGSASRMGFTVNAGVSNFSLPSSVSTSPMAGVTGSSPGLTNSVFPERPRYTSVSTPVAGGLAGCGPFDTDALQNTMSLFGPPGPSNGPVSLTLESSKGLSLNFTTAPWN